MVRPPPGAAMEIAPPLEVRTSRARVKISPGWVAAPKLHSGNAFGCSRFFALKETGRAMPTGDYKSGRNK